MSISPQSRVWIYQSDRKFSNTEENLILEKLSVFTNQWKAHGSELSAFAEIKHGLFIVLVVDETQASVTGCSIDSSVRLMKEIEQELKVDLFNRFNVVYLAGEEAKLVSRAQFEQLLSSAEITEESIVFNNLVQNLVEYQTKWQTPFKNSWHSKVFEVSSPTL